MQAIFLGGCNTVHEYKDKIKAMFESDMTSLVFEKYEIAECFAMKYENFIYLCNHVNDRFEMAGKLSCAKSNQLEVSMFYCTKADKVLLLSFLNKKVAVLYNAGQKVELRPNSHRLRDLRNAEKRKLKLLRK